MKEQLPHDAPVLVVVRAAIDVARDYLSHADWSDSMVRLQRASKAYRAKPAAGGPFARCANCGYDRRFHDIDGECPEEGFYWEGADEESPADIEAAKLVEELPTIPHDPCKHCVEALSAPWVCKGCGHHPMHREIECCNPKCKGEWGTGCYHCHHPSYGERR